MKKAVWRIVGAVASLAAVLFVVALFSLRASLPQTAGELMVAGLNDAVTIERDAAGVPVITAKTRLDLAFATGFAHGQDRSFQMDLIRRQAAGELSEIVGSAALQVDMRYRLHRFRARAVGVLSALPAADREVLNRYADGVNAGRESLGARQFEYFVLGVEPEPWLPEDSVLVVYAMFVQLNDSRASKDIRRGRAQSILPREVYEWMYPDGSPWDAPLVGEPRTAKPIPSAEVFSLRDVNFVEPEVTERGRAPLNGSNNWAVSGAHTRSGRAMVSNDMHLGLSTPNIYYRARLVMDGAAPLDITGVTLPGAPFVVAGSNTQIAWGYTNSYGDYTDAVVLQPGVTPGTYETPDGDQPFAVHRETILIKDEPAPYVLDVRETIWGPVLEEVDYSDREVAVSWIAHRAESVNLNIMKLESATSVFAALDIANTMGMPPQNFVTGDAEGNIGWTIAGSIPGRADYDPMLPADWSQVNGWAGWLEPQEYPRVINPDSGRIWTANSRVVDADALRLIGDGGYDLGARARQIRDRLFEKERFEPEDMLAIQYDDEAVFLRRWRDLLLELLDDATIAGDQRLENYRELVRDWIPRAAPESVGYRLVRAFRLDVRRRLFKLLTSPVREAYGDDIRLRISNQFEAALWSVVIEKPQHLLPANVSDWSAFLLGSVHRNIDYFEQKFDGPLSDRSWGEINTAAIRHPLAASIPLVGKYFDMPAQPLNGDANLPKAQGPAFGASERFSVMPGDEKNSLLHMPTGASGHPLSPYYDAGHSDWVHGRASPFLPGPATQTLTLMPEGR